MSALYVLGFELFGAENRLIGVGAFVSGLEYYVTVSASRSRDCD